jgi:hypothetical protein
MSSKLLLAKAAEVFYGAVKYARAINSYDRAGVPITPELRFHSFGAIAAASANAIATSQSVGAGAAFSLNGALVSGGVATLPTPRNVVAAWTTASVLTITGTDEYGSIMVEVSASGTSHTGKKAFKTITSITSSAAITLATVGTGTVIGLPFRVDENGLIIAKQAGATDAATFVEADTTSPATGTTGDVRGTVAFAQAPNGAILFAVLIKCADPSTKVGAYGVKQFGSTDSE